MTVFEYLSTEKQLKLEQRKNQALQAHVKVLEDAIVELAAIISEEDQDG